MKFYDRKTELDSLTRFEHQAEKHFFFIRLTGRRRIGKTVLIRKYLKKTSCRSLFFFVTKKNEKLLLEEYAKIISEDFDEYAGIAFKNIDDFFKFLLNMMRRKKIIVVFDEFQNFRYVDDAAFSILQKHIDNFKDDANGLFIVIGSVSSMMRKIFDDNKQPLFGRLNGNFHLRNFSTGTIGEILSDHNVTSNADQIFYYSIFEGIPFYYNYISQVDGFGKSGEAFLRDVVLPESSILLNEGKEILLEEFGKDYSTYFSILEAVACGATSVSRIADNAGVAVNSLGRYISQLTDNHELLERRVPFDSPSGNKMGRYYLRDNFLDFWFRYIFKNKSRIEILSTDRIAAEIAKDFPTYMGKKFEKYMIAYLVEKNRTPDTGTTQLETGKFDRIGQYWDRGETEIDIIFTDDEKKEISFGECKLSPRRFQVKDMEKKINRFLNSKAKYRDWKKRINLYSPEAEHFLFKSIDF